MELLKVCAGLTHLLERFEWFSGTGTLNLAGVLARFLVVFETFLDWRHWESGFAQVYVHLVVFGHYFLDGAAVISGCVVGQQAELLLALVWLLMQVCEVVLCQERCLCLAMHVHLRASEFWLDVDQVLQQDVVLSVNLVFSFLIQNVRKAFCLLCMGSGILYGFGVLGFLHWASRCTRMSSSPSVLMICEPQ